MHNTSGDDALFVQFDDSENPPHRQHPWIDAAKDPNARYYNFMEHPELITEVLEDFKAFAHHRAIQTFYDLLRWLNGPDSPFETNDCGLRPPRIDHGVPDVVRVLFDADPVVMHGRLTVLYRDLRLNASRPHIDWLKKCIHDALRDRVPNFAAAVFVGDWPHLFTAIDKTGYVVSLRYWAWGEDEAMGVQNLGGVFENLLGLFQSIATALNPTASA